LIPVSQPYYDEREEEAVVKVLRSKWIGMGPITEEFEKKFAKRVGAKYAVAVNSCTAALHIAAHLLGLKPGDNIIVPTMTFIPTACVANYLGAKPIFCDIDENTLLIDWQDALNRVNENTKAIFPVCYAGQFIYPPEVNLPLVFDCAQAISFNAAGKTCCWSFQAVKNLATGDGGMLTTDNLDVYEQAKQARWFGINRNTWESYQSLDKRVWGYPIEKIGYKYHMNDLAAAIGLVQLDKLDEMQALRKKLIERYFDRLSNHIRLLPLEESSYYIMVIRHEHRDKLSKFLNNNGIATQVHHKPVHLYPFYYEYSLPVAEKVWQEILTLPLFPGLSLSKVDYICDKILEFQNR